MLIFLSGNVDNSGHFTFQPIVHNANNKRAKSRNNAIHIRTIQWAWIWHVVPVDISINLCNGLVDTYCLRIKSASTLEVRLQNKPHQHSSALKLVTLTNKIPTRLRNLCRCANRVLPAFCVKRAWAIPALSRCAGRGVSSPNHHLQFAKRI